MSEAETETKPDKPDRRIGSYRLVQPLGSGGMSSVFRAVHTESGLEVAVKVLPRSLAKNPTTLQRFLREAKNVEALQHPNIVAIYDRGVDQGRYYLVLELIHGGDLHECVRTNGPMPIDDSVKLIREVAEGLRYAAGQGVIHRDIKPANLLFTDSGKAKITDLGLALQSVEEDERVTREGTTVGTVDYMSPEQARDSRATSVKSDIYSLGCTFFFLLTGGPPYPGGDVAEKLAKHCMSPPVDPRSIRPEIPAPLANLVLKMMAKKAEKRFADYDELLAALDAAQGVAPPVNSPEQPLDAIIVDDDDEDGPDSAILLTVADGPGSPSKPPARRSPPPHDEILMADLAELDSVGTPALKKPPKPVVEAVAQIPLKRGEGLPAPEHESLLGEEVDPEYALPGSMPAGFPSASSRKMSASERSWITACVLGGLGLIVLVIAVDQLIKASKTPEAETQANGESFSPEPIEAVKPPSPVAGSAVAAVTKHVPPVPPPVLAKDSEKVKTKTNTALPSVKPIPVEPSDPTSEVIAEAAFAPGVEAKFRPEWATSEIPTRIPGKFTTVQRMPDPANPDQKPTLRAALDVSGGGTIEVADNGPFFVNDLHFGESRLIRARSGFRPVIRLERPKVEPSTGYLDLGDRSLTLDGIDLIVDVSDLPRAQTSLFLCGGGTLNLQNCTITVVNRSGFPFSIIATKPSEKFSRIRIERSTLRGAFTAVADLGSSDSELFCTRSVVFNGQGVGFLVVGSPTAIHGLYLSRNISVTRGSLVEMSDAPAGARSKPLLVKAIGNTLAHFQTPMKSSLMNWRGNGANVREMVLWQGDHNLLQGWSAWFSVGTNHAVRVADLASARSIWPGTDPKTTEENTTWPAPQSPDRVTPEDLRVLAIRRADVLARAAAPGAFLHQKTVEPFPKVIVPETEASEGKGGTATPGSGSNPGGAPTLSTGSIGTSSDPSTFIRPSGSKARLDTRQSSGGTSLTGKNRTAVAGVRWIDFDAEAAPLRGDIGLLLAESVRPGDRLVRVQVSGSTVHKWTPYRMPDGVSLEIVVTENDAGSSPSWTISRGISADALIEVRNASLLLDGVHIERDGSPLLKNLIKVEQGHLVLHRCRFRTPGRAEPEGGKLIAFNAPGTLPLEPPSETLVANPVVPRQVPTFGPERATKAVTPTTPTPPFPDAWPFLSRANKPTLRASDCILIGGGDVVDAKVGRGLLAFFNCVIVSGQNAFSLNPGHVARSRLEADLVLTRCSIASENSIISFGRWTGSDPGPDRPWLVTTQNCLFVASYDKPDVPSVLLRADPVSLAHGTVFWQASGDAFEVPVFLATGATTPPSTSASRKPDVNQQWASLWGEAHFHNVSGPKGPTGVPGTRLAAKLRVGDVEPADLAIDPNYPPRRSHHELGVDFTALGINPANRAGNKR